MDSAFLGNLSTLCASLKFSCSVISVMPKFYMAAGYWIKHEDYIFNVREDT